MSQQTAVSNQECEYLFVQDASTGDANFPLGQMSETAALRAAGGMGPGYLYRKPPGGQTFQLWKPVGK